MYWAYRLSENLNSHHCQMSEAFFKTLTLGEYFFESANWIFMPGANIELFI